VVTSGGVVDLTAGIGVVPLEAGPDVEELVARADLAVRAAHAAGPGTAARYRPELGAAAVRRDRLRIDLVGAAGRDELFLLFQPIVSLSEQRVTGVEATLRWRHPELGEIPPAEFLPLAERTGVVGELLCWALEEAAAAVASLPTDEEPPLRIGLTVPAGYLATGRVVPDVEQALRTSGLAPERLVLQIGTATLQSADERVALDVSSLRLMGVHVALEGFGGEGSALAHLTQLRTDIVKLDRSLITRLDRDPQSQALCESLVRIATSVVLGAWHPKRHCAHDWHVPPAGRRGERRRTGGTCRVRRLEDAAGARRVRPRVEAPCPEGALCDGHLGGRRPAVGRAVALEQVAAVGAHEPGVHLQAAVVRAVRIRPRALVAVDAHPVVPPLQRPPQRLRVLHLMPPHQPAGRLSGQLGLRVREPGGAEADVQQPAPVTEPDDVAPDLLHALAPLRGRARRVAAQRLHRRLVRSRGRARRSEQGHTEKTCQEQAGSSL